MSSTIQIEIVSPEKLLISATATAVQLPGKDGILGILPGHSPLITELGIGELSYTDGTGNVVRLNTAWGIAEVLSDKVTVLATVAERAEDIDVKRAQSAKDRAETRLKSPTPEVDPSRAEKALQKASSRISVAGTGGKPE